MVDKLLAHCHSNRLQLCIHHQLIYCEVFLLSLDLCSYSIHFILVTKLCLVLYCACVRV